MLSYQWDNQATVSKVYDALSQKGIPCWMDIKGGMSGSINEAMAEGVENAATICPFMTTAYQNSKNCKKELNYAESIGVEIVPVMLDQTEGYKATGWLGIATAGLLWQDFRNSNNFDASIELLVGEIRKRCPKLKTMDYATEAPDAKVTALEAKLEKQKSDMKEMEKKMKSTSVSADQGSVKAQQSVKAEQSVKNPANGFRIFTNSGKCLSTQRGKHGENRGEIIASENEQKNVEHQNIGLYPVGLGEFALKIYSTPSKVVEVDQGDEKKRWEGKNLGKFNYPKNGRISVMDWHGVPSQKWVLVPFNDRYFIRSQGNPKRCLEAVGNVVKLEKTKNSLTNGNQLFKLVEPFNEQAGPMTYNFEKAVSDIKTAEKSVILSSNGKPFTSDWGDAGLASPNGKTFHEWPLSVNLHRAQKSVQWQLMRHGPGSFHVFMDIAGKGMKAWDICLAQYKHHQTVLLWDKHNGANQKWALRKESGDFYRFYSCGDGSYCLDMKAEAGGQWDGSGFLNRLKIAKHDKNSKTQLFNLGGARVVDESQNFLGYMNSNLQ